MSQASGTCERDLVLKVGSRIIRWIIGPEHDRAFAERILRPWAVPDAIRLPFTARADFTVGVYLKTPGDIEFVREAPNLSFLLSGEAEKRFPHGDRCFEFVQHPRPEDDRQTRYCPTLGIWTAPFEAAQKKRICSALESKGRSWRMNLFDQVEAKVGMMDKFGSAYGRPLGGYHRVGPEPGVFSKHEALTQYAFSAAVERISAFDYLTEKFTDPILCEAVPIYSGCPNVHEYALDGSFVPLEAIEKIDWTRWDAEYAKRRPTVLRQKSLVRTTFNILSYFIRLTGRLELLDQLRPITLNVVEKCGWSDGAG